MMSKDGFKLEFDAGRGQGFPTQLTIVASQQVIEQLKQQLDGSRSDALQFCELEPAETVPLDVIDQAETIIVEVDPDQPQSMQRLVKIHSRRPHLPRIVALANANISIVRQLLREGVADVVSLPLQIEAIYDTAASVMESARVDAVGKVETGPMIAVVRAQGGEGATTVVTHIARHLADNRSLTKGVCIVDLDVQVGGVAPYLGLSPKRNIDDLLRSGARLDRSVLRSVAVDRGDGIHVIAAPFDIQPLEQIDTEQLLRVIELARQEFDYVLLDLPADWTNWNLSALLEATKVLMVVELRISSLRQAKRQIELFNSVGFDSAKVAVVVNQVTRRLFSNIDVKDVAEALKRDVLVSLSDEGDKISSAQDQGLLLPELHRKSRFDTEIKKLVDIIFNQASKVEKK